MTPDIHIASSTGIEPVLGRTLPSWLADTVAKTPDVVAFEWQAAGGSCSVTFAEFKEEAHEVALALGHQGLRTGDRVALFCRSDYGFALSDMGCLAAGIIDVPIYPSVSRADFLHIMLESAAGVLFVSSASMLEGHVDCLDELKALRLVVLLEGDIGELFFLPDHVSCCDLGTLRGQGRAILSDDGGQSPDWAADLDPDQTATIVYTSGTTGRPKGVMLSHGNISFVAMTGVQGMTGIEPHADNSALSFLPLAHVFQRSFHYALIAYGISTTFCEPLDMVSRAPVVQPTIFATVPRVLERIYERIFARRSELTGIQRRIYRWALRLAARYQMDVRPSGWYAVQLWLADRLVFSKWRALFGGRLKIVVCGGAPLSSQINNFFVAAGINVIQGYGLTETSPTVTYNRVGRNRAGTVGEPIEGVEVAIAEDGEVLVRGPSVMQGYFRRPEATNEVVDGDGWFHTGDIGEFGADGRLRIKDRKKNLFKLSTGLYVTPQPLEGVLTGDRSVEQAVVVGAGRKFCAALIFPSRDEITRWGRNHRVGVDSYEDLIQHPRFLARMQRLVDHANRTVAEHSRIKQFRALAEAPTMENGLLTPTLKIKRAVFRDTYADVIEDIYGDQQGA